MVQDRKQEYTSLRNARLATVEGQRQRNTERKKTANDAFAKRQQERLQVEAQEKERLRQWRLKSLEENKVDLHMDMREGEPGYGPTRWCWPTAHHHPRHSATGFDVKVDFLLGPGGMISKSGTTKLLDQHGGSELHALIDRPPSHLDEIKKRDAEMRRMRLEAEAEAAAVAKAEREAEAVERRKAIVQKQEAEKAAAIAQSSRIKKEMRSETSKTAQDEANRAQVRYEKAMTERAENVKRHMMDTRLRDDIALANERPEGSKMSEGAKFSGIPTDFTPDM